MMREKFLFPFHFDLLDRSLRIQTFPQKIVF